MNGLAQKDDFMHELAIAQQLIETACTALPDTGGAAVTALHVQLGALAGVSAEELRFGFGVVASATPLANARLEIEMVPAIVYCPHCATEYTLEPTAAFGCPVCHSMAVQVIQGKELLLKAIEIADEGQPAQAR